MLLIKNNKGLSLVEVIVALGILGMAMLGIFQLFSNSLNLLEISQMRTNAYNLASEGIELAKHVRSEGCEFENLGTSPANDPTNANDFYYVRSDINAANPRTLARHLPTDTDLTFVTTGFERKIYIYDTTNAALSTLATQLTEGADKYYNVRAEVKYQKKNGTWETKPFEISTIMLRKWQQ